MKGRKVKGEMMMIEHLNVISLYLICISTGVVGGIATLFHKVEDNSAISTIQLIAISFLAFAVSIVFGITFFELDPKTIIVYAYSVLTFEIFLMYKKKVTPSSFLIIVASLSIVIMFLPLESINEYFNLVSENFFNIINIFTIIPISLSLIMINRFKKDNLKNRYVNIISLVLLGVIAVVIVPSKVSAIISAIVIIFPTSFIIGIMKIESEQTLSDLKDKLNSLETEFNYELRKELNRRTFHLKEVQEKMSHINKIDDLTKAYNKKAILDIMDDLSADRKIETFSIIMFDLDNFKMLNDKLGHIQGDLCLRALANLAFESVRDSDYFGRYGGDEFILALPNANLQTALTIAERFRMSVATKTKPRFTVSIGLASYPSDGRNTKELLDIADKGLYYSKEKGRNRVSYHNPDLDKKF